MNTVRFKLVSIYKDLKLISTLLLGITSKQHCINNFITWTISQDNTPPDTNIVNNDQAIIHT